MAGMMGMETATATAIKTMTRHLSRRTLLSGAVATVGTALLAACGGVNGAGSGASTPSASGAEMDAAPVAKGAAPVGDGTPVAASPTVAGAAGGAVIEQAGTGYVGYVYVLTNTQENAVAVWGRGADGRLTPFNVFATEGAGIGDQEDGEALGSQSALTMSADGRYLYAVNGGSGDISAFSVAGGQLTLLGRIGSNGPRPISLTIAGNVMYVLNNNRQAGTSGNITGFLLTNGRLSPLAGSTRTLSSNNPVDPGQVQFSPDGKILLVPEKKTNCIVVYVVGTNGLVTSAKVWDIASRTPFALAFGNAGIIVTADANGDRMGEGTASSHKVYTDGTLTFASQPVANGQTASCWVAVSPNGQLAYTANFLSKTLTGYRIGSDGALSMLYTNGVSARANGGTRDVGFTPDGRYLYALNTLAGTVSGFAVEGNGALAAVGEFGRLNYSGANGMVVR